MLIHRGERYRLYPTAAQEARLAAWEDGLRWLWNTAHAERLAKQEAGYRAPTAFDQINDLTAMRRSLPWLANVPRDVCAQALVELDRAWQRAAMGLVDRPYFKRRRLGERAPLIAPQGFRVEGRGRKGGVVFPKAGTIRAVIHRAPSGSTKTCAIVRDGDQWFACVSCELEVADPLPSMKRPIALDVGVVHLVADSDGGFVENPRHAEKLQPRIRRAQRVVARRQKGSKNQQKARAKVSRLQRRVRRQREHALHVASKGYAKSHGVLLVEDLKIKNMSASARGTVEEPGTRVVQKAGLNRAILGAGWGRFVEMLTYKVIPEGGTVIRRPAAYSSQECALCHHIDAASRVSRDLFVCIACGHTKHADTNASQVILSRWAREIAVEPTVAVCGGTAARGRPAKQKLRVVRRGTRHVDPGALPTVEAPAFMAR